MTRIAAASAILSVGIWLACSPISAQPAEESVGEPLSRGPVHEAFADLMQINPGPGKVVEKAPPPAVEEIPPDTKPEGDDVVWIPGYWAWDDERNDYIWVSGIWRNPPPGAAWVPGYWSEAEGGYAWTPGYWSTNSQDPDADGNLQVAYLPPPPSSLEQGPSGPPPTPNSIWIPGSWIWANGHYAWRPGFWIAGRENWVWMPDRYVWRPNGYVFSPGYWDYPLANRGLLFAPVYFPNNAYAQPGFRYAPNMLLNVAYLTSALFGRAGNNSYYYGNYFGPQYAQNGYMPWYGLNRTAYNPLYDHARWMGTRTDPQWASRMQQVYREQSEHAAAAPAPPPGSAGQFSPAGQHYFANGQPLVIPLKQAVATGSIPHAPPGTIAGPLAHHPAGSPPPPLRPSAGPPGSGPGAAAPPDAHPQGLKLEALDAQRREQAAQRAKQLAQYQAQRQQAEMRHAPGGQGAPAAAPPGPPPAGNAPKPPSPVAPIKPQNVAPPTRPAGGPPAIHPEGRKPDVPPAPPAAGPPPGQEVHHIAHPQSPIAGPVPANMHVDHAPPPRPEHPQPAPHPQAAPQPHPQPAPPPRAPAAPAPHPQAAPAPRPQPAPAPHPQPAPAPPPQKGPGKK